MEKKTTILFLSGLIFAALLGVLIITVFCDNNSQGVPEADPRIDVTKIECTGYSNMTILKEYGNWSKAIYYDHDNWDTISPQDIYFDKYRASNGGPVTGCGINHCFGGICIWWDPDIPINETVMDEIYSLFCDRAKETGMEEPYLIFVPQKLYPD